MTTPLSNAHMTSLAGKVMDLLQAALDADRMTIAAHEKTIASLRSVVDAKTDTVSVLCKTIEDKNAELANLQRSFAGLLSVVDGKTNTVSVLCGTIEDKNVEIARARLEARAELLREQKKHIKCTVDGLSDRMSAPFIGTDDQESLHINDLATRIKVCREQMEHIIDQLTGIDAQLASL